MSLSDNSFIASILALRFIKFKSSQFVTNVLFTLGNRILVMALGLITSVAVARYLGPEGRGQFAVAALITGLGVQFGNLGLHASNTYEVAKYPDRLSVLLGNSLVAGLGFGTALTIIAISMQWIFPHMASIGGMLWWLAAIAIPIGITNLLLQNLLLGLHRVKEFNLVELAGKLITAMLMAVALFVGWRTPEWMTAATLIAILVSSLWCLTLLKAGVSEVRFSLPQFYSSISFGAKAYFAALFAFLQQRIALLLVQQDFGDIEAGYLSVAMTLFDLALVIPFTVGTILFPRLSAIQNEKVRWELAFKVTLFVGGGMFILASIIYFISDFIVRNIFGEGFLPAVGYLQWLLPGLVLLSISSILMNYLGSMKMPIVVVYAPALALLSMLICFCYGRTLLAGESAAAATSVGYFISLVVITIFLCYKKGTWKT